MSTRIILAEAGAGLPADLLVEVHVVAAVAVVEIRIQRPIQAGWQQKAISR